MHLPDFKHCRVLVAGDLMLDRYWHGATSRISPEAPVPVVRIDEIEDRAGGAANVAINVACLGATTSLIGQLGTDESGTILLGLLKSSKVECLVSRSDVEPTITKLRIVSRHQQLIRLDFEENSKDPAKPGITLERHPDALSACNVIILSDYGKGTIQDPQSLIQSAVRAGKPILVDPKGSDFSKYRGATLLTPNRHEFEIVVGRTHNEQELIEKGERLRKELDLEALLITRGAEGMTLIENGKRPVHLEAHAKDVFDVTGAGDTVIATLAAALGSGASLSEATAVANIAAGIVVSKLGTATVSPVEIQKELQGFRAPSRGVIALEPLLHEVAGARARGEVIVLTNGCFDLLHPGHVDYLTRARQLGDRLVVLVNSDESVQRLKGPDRPINALDHRMTMLSALECVDWVCPFSEDTPKSLIGLLLPDILVKGGDYTDITKIAGYDLVLANGGSIEIIDFVEGHSTTSLIERIHHRSRSQPDV